MRRKRFIKLTQSIGLSKSAINILINFVVNRRGKTSYSAVYANLKQNLIDVGLKHFQSIDSDHLGELLSRNGKLDELNNNLDCLCTMAQTYDYNFELPEFSGEKLAPISIDLNEHSSMQDVLNSIQNQIYGALGIPKHMLFQDS